MRKIISLVILMVFILMSCAMEPAIPEDVTISGYDGRFVLDSESIQLTSNVPVSWSDNAPNGLVTVSLSEVVVTATDYDGYEDTITIDFNDSKLVKTWSLDNSDAYYIFYDKLLL